MVLRAICAGGLLAVTLAACSGEAPQAEETSAAPASMMAAPQEEEAEADTATTADEGMAETAEAAPATKAPEPATAPVQAAAAPVAAPAAMTAAAPAAELVKVAEVSHPASYNRCVTCHTANKGGEDKLGPNLYGVYRSPAAQGSFSYSSALKESGLVWDEANLHKWLENPRAMVPGNRMSFPGIKDAAKRQEIIDYLKKQS
ncbi:MAG: c-type cytochrome [Erythrobacter sp.]